MLSEKLTMVVENHPYTKYAREDIAHTDILKLPGYIVTRDGQVYSEHTFEYLSLREGSNGYLQVKLRDIRGHRKTISVHRLVAKLFLPKTGRKKILVNHKDTNKKNNHVDNLEWCTPLGNVHHAIENGLIKTSVPEDKIHGICRCLENNFSIKEICRMYSVSKTTVQHIRRRLIHTDISSKYKFDSTKNDKRFKTYPKETVIEICKLLENGFSNKSISKRLNVNVSSVNSIRKKRMYISISKDYSF